MTKARDLADLLDASGNIIAQGTIDGRDLASDGSKLDSIEHGATGDQTHSEIRALIDVGVDTNVFTDADHTKLDGIEANATADQTSAEIKTSYESNANTNAFTDTEQTKLSGIEAGATADQTASEIRALVESATDSNVFTDADHTKLNAIESGATADQTKADIDALNINADTLDGQHGSYYTGYTDTAVANLVDTAPGTLDTLNELAAALGDDPNFATTTATNIGTKANKTITVSAGSGLTGGGDLTANRTISHADTSTVSDVNGSGNTFIQDIGFDTYGHVTSVGTGTVTVGDGAMTVTAGSGLSGGGQLGTANQSGASSISLSVTDAPKWTTARTLSLSGDASGSVSWDGSGNATLSAALTYRELGESPVGNFGQFVNHGATADFNAEPAYWGWSFVNGNTNAPNTSSSQWYRSRLSLGDPYGKGTGASDYWLEITIPRSGGSAGEMWTRRCEGGTIGSWRQSSAYVSGNTVWHAGNDGAGSGLDADLLDGVQGSSYLRVNGDGSQLTGISGTPAGAVIYHAGSTPPTGFIKANGASLSTSTYAALFSAIGYTYGGSGGSFNVPDLRGEFLRGWDDGRGVDSGRGFGSSQLDQMQRITGYYRTSAEHFNIGSGSGVFRDTRVGGARNSGIGYGNATALSFDSGNSSSARVSSSTSGETRSRNVALLACIKF